MRGFLLLLSCLACPVMAEDLPALFSVTGVATNDVLNVRQAPDPASAIIGSLSPDATGVEVIDENNGWATVNADEGTGYVAARFLVRTSDTPWYRLEQLLTCAGTEPFWSFAIDAPKKSVTFTSAESPDPRILPVQGLWPGETWSPSAALAIAEGTAVLRHEACSDGMSDRGYGIAIDIFLNGGNHRISGCCTLAATPSGD